MTWSRRKRLDPGLYGTLKDEYKVEHDAEILGRILAEQTAVGNNNALAASVFKSYSRIMVGLIVLNTVSLSMQYASPFLVYMLVNYLEDRADEDLEWDSISKGFYLCLALVLTQVTAFVLNNHIRYWQELTGTRASMAISLLIQRKQLKLG